MNLHVCDYRLYLCDLKIIYLQNNVNVIPCMSYLGHTLVCKVRDVFKYILPRPIFNIFPKLMILKSAETQQKSAETQQKSAETQQKIGRNSTKNRPKLNKIILVDRPKVYKNWPKLNKRKYLVKN